MKKTTLALLLVCVLVCQTEAWPVWSWFEDENVVTTIPTTTDPPVTETTSVPSQEPPSFWTNLYSQLKAIFASFSDTDKQVKPTNTSHLTSWISTHETLQTTDFKTTTDSIEDQGFFQGFFVSLANGMANIYGSFGSLWGNSSQEIISDISYYPALFAEEVDALFQNYSLPIAGYQDITTLKASIVDALVSAWNTSLELGEIPVVSPREIQEKIFETLQEAQLFPSKMPVMNGTTIMPSRHSPATVNPDEIAARFLDLLKKADRAPDGMISGTFPEPSPDVDRAELSQRLFGRRRN